MAVPYLTPTDLRSVKGLEDVTMHPDADLARLVAVFEGIVEGYRGVAFTPRVATETVQLWQCTRGLLRLPWPMVRSVTSVTVDGTLLAVDSYRRVDGGVYSASGFYGDEAVIVYEHGYDEPGDLTWPGAAVLLNACRNFVRSSAKLERSQVGRDQLSAVGPDGATVQYATPDAEQGRPTGYLDVDRDLNLLPDHRIPGVG